MQKKLLSIIETFSLAERMIFYIFVGIFCVSGIALLWQVNKQFLVERPDYGGSLTEGVIGSPRFINPLLAISDTDKDLTELLYAGLLRVNSDGTLTPELAQSYTLSEDGLTYTFVLKKNIFFSNGKPVTADDVVFTIEKAEDSLLKSPRKASWDGVTVIKIDDRTVQFTLKQAYAPFIQNMTLGILPKEIWSKASPEEFPFSQFNTKPIGAGPYEIDNIVYNSSGLPEEYHLKAFSKYILGKPYITNINIKSYSDENALVNAYKKGDIENMYGISPKLLPDLKLEEGTVNLSPLPRVFGIFFNQNVAPVLVYKEVRQALSTALDRNEVVNTVLGGYGQAITGPIPPKTLGPKNAGETKDNIVLAQEILTKAGWKKNASGIFEKKDKKNTVTLSLSISTGDAPELKETAEIIQKQWQALGAQVSVKIFEISDLNQNILRPRKYDALLFGEIVGRDLDLYPFWHSSERNDPGLNIAMYTNIKVDKILDTLRHTNDLTEQEALYKNFDTELEADIPAVFVYSPYFLYIVPKKVHNTNLGQLNSASERFSNVWEWYIETNNVWKIFTK